MYKIAAGGIAIEGASILVHEACHMIQHDEGRRISRYDSDGKI